MNATQHDTTEGAGMSTDDRLDRIDASLVEIKASHAETRVLVESFAEKVESHEKTIAGNGQVGLKTQMALLVQMVTDIKAAAKNSLTIPAIKQLLNALAVLVTAIAGALWIVNL